MGSGAAMRDQAAAIWGNVMVLASMISQVRTAFDLSDVDAKYHPLPSGVDPRLPFKWFGANFVNGKVIGMPSTASCIFVLTEDGSSCPELPEPPAECPNSQTSVADKW